MRILSLVLFFALVASAATAAPPFFRGVSYTLWSKDVLNTATSDSSIDRMKGDGVDTVALNVFWFQDNAHSTVITEDFTRYSASQDSVRHAIRHIHLRSMKVLLKPMVDLRDGNWRGTIVPSAAWFKAYAQFINLWADIARQEKVECFCVGCEYQMPQTETVSWRTIVKGVRSHFSGKLTYASNFDSYNTVLWWDAVDYIGIDAYFVLTNQDDPSLPTLQNAWSGLADKLQAWRTTLKLNVPIVFTEVGYQSTQGTNKTPWSTTGPLDLDEQANCYLALFSTLSKRSWWGGGFWWAWETDPSAGGSLDTSFSPQNKPAEGVLKTFYLTP